MLERETTLVNVPEYSPFTVLRWSWNLDKLKGCQRMNTSQLATVKAYMADEDILSLIKGSPGLETLKNCKDILLKATNAVLVR